MKRIYYILVLICTIYKSNAQFFSHEVKINKVTNAGLHKIAINSNVKQYITNDLHDVRIYDSALKEVPYFYVKEPLIKSKSDFVAYKILSQKHHKVYAQEITEIIVHNPDKNTISNIAFNINNSDAYKYCAVEGSDDMKQWYSISEHQELSLIYSNVYTDTYKIIYFPKNNYTYFRLLVDDWYSQPLKINSAGFFKLSTIAGKLNEISFSKKIVENNVNKTTAIHLSFLNKQQIDRIDFKIKNPRLFNRTAFVYVIRERTLKHHKIEKYQQLVYEFKLNSAEPLLIDLEPMNEKEIIIEIENKDNPPLEIESISCKQLESYLICDLTSNNNYTLKFGNTNLKLPEYDLSNFITSMPQLLPEATIGLVKEIPKSVSKTGKKPKSFFETKTFLWLCLGIGAIILFLFSRSLLNDINGKKET